MPTDLHAFLRSRRSIRRFRSDPVPAPIIRRLIMTASHAPSAHNLQPWRFAVINDPIYRANLGQALTQKMRNDMVLAGAPSPEIESRLIRSLNRLEQAPLVILLCQEASAVKSQAREELLMAVQSVAAAGTQLLLAAHAEGLAGTWICWPLFAQRETVAALDLPATWIPQAMYFVGYALETPPRRKLLSLRNLLLER